MTHQTRHQWGIVVPGVLAIICIVTASAWGYWQYVNYVPPFRPQLPPMPSPNGYVKAQQALAQLSKIRHPPVPANWPHVTLAQLRAQLAVRRPILDQVRAIFPLEWRAPAVLDVNDTFAAMPSHSEFRECARCFADEGILARSEGDYGAAMQSSLDAIELGSKIPNGGGLISRLTGLACHAIGFDQAERTVSGMPAGAIPGALARLRRVRREWPSLSETLESERISHLAMDSQAFLEIQLEPLHGQLQFFRPDNASLWDAVLPLLTPRRTILASTDRFYRRQIGESTRPFRQRVAVPVPGDWWSRATLLSITPQILVRQEREGTHLALFEVALAVRMHYLQHGRYPARLSDISREWLPAIPVDLWDQPIAYRLRNSQPVIYSLGPDGKDDGGRAADPITLTPATRGDLVFGKMSHRLRQH
jgi:hypothetical protein